MIDTHTHLYSRQYGEDAAGAVERALAAGVTHIVLPNTDHDSIGPLLELHRRYPECTSVAMGLHPTDITDAWPEDLAEVEQRLDTEKCVAVGEVGMDLYHDRSRREEQREVFARQLRMAIDRGLPVIIHCREALDDTLEVLRSVEAEGRGLPQLVFHSFTGSTEDVRRIREVCDPMFGINGVVTFKNSVPLQEALSEIGLERIVLETDSPYLAPVPYRGKRNESAYLPEVCLKVAQLTGKTPAQIEAVTDANARRLFDLPT
ncbi:MAG: TatD family hydrolase [Muribaculaceae bacterium]|nr:TatD family hydrolase [Muribaculaceae bacterium]